MKKIILVLVVMLLIIGCAPADEQYTSSTVSESKTVEKDLLPIVGETGQGKVYQLNEFCFIYENSLSYAPSQLFCMTMINQ